MHSSHSGKAASYRSRGGHQAKTERRSLLRIIVISVLVIMVIIAVGCRETSDPVENGNGVLPDGVHVDFKVAVDDAGLSALLNDLGNPVVLTCYSVKYYVYVNVPAGKTATQAIDSLKASPLVEYAKPSCRPDEIVVGFNAWCDRERASALLKSLGSLITWDPEWGYSAVLRVTEGETVADVVDTLNCSPLVQFAEPCCLSAEGDLLCERCIPEPT